MNEDNKQMLAFLVLVFAGIIAVGALVSSFGGDRGVSASTKERISERTQYLILQANAEYGFPVHLAPVITYEPLRADGKAGYTDCLNISIHLDEELAIKNPDVLVNEVLAHEMSHLVHCGIYGNLGDPPHNSEWREICHFLGGAELCEK